MLVCLNSLHLWKQMLFILDDLPRESDCWGLLQESKLLLLHGSAGLAGFEHSRRAPASAGSRAARSEPQSLVPRDFSSTLARIFSCSSWRHARLAVLSKMEAWGASKSFSLNLGPFVFSLLETPRGLSARTLCIFPEAHVSWQCHLWLNPSGGWTYRRLHPTDNILRAYGFSQGSF